MFPLAGQYDGMVHVTSVFAGSTAHSLDHLDLVSNMVAH